MSYFIRAAFRGRGELASEYQAGSNLTQGQHYTGMQRNKLWWYELPSFWYNYFYCSILCTVLCFNGDCVHMASPKAGDEL